MISARKASRREERDYEVAAELEDLANILSVAQSMGTEFRLEMR
jgi:hypothetical protein